MLVRTFTCPNCGASTRSNADTAYAYCGHCGSYAGYDFACLRWLNQCQSAREYALYIGPRWAIKEELRLAGNRDSFQSMERADWEYYIVKVPEFHPKDVDQPGQRRETYLDWYAKTATERAFNEKIRKLSDQLAEFMGTLPWNRKSNDLIGITLSLPKEAFLNLAEQYLNNARIEADIFQNQGLIDLHPDRIPLAHYSRLSASNFIQAWSQFLDGPTILAYLDKYHLRGSYQWIPEKEKETCCNFCGSLLGVNGKEGEMICDACGHTVIVGAVPFNCTGCGAPLSLEPDADLILCPYCTTLSAVGTFDSYLGYR